MSYVSSVALIVGALIIVLVIAGVAALITVLALRKKGSRVNAATASQSPVAANSENREVCPNCKEPVESGMVYCMKCGTKVR
jgi:hypothetical protein